MPSIAATWLTDKKPFSLLFAQLKYIIADSEHAVNAVRGTIDKDKRKHPEKTEFFRDVFKYGVCRVLRSRFRGNLIE